MKGEEGRNAVRKTAFARYQFYHRAVGIGKTFKAYLRPVTKSMEKNMFLSFLMGTVVNDGEKSFKLPQIFF